jgi:hypothetical protein
LNHLTVSFCTFLSAFTASRLGCRTCPERQPKDAYIVNQGLPRTVQSKFFDPVVDKDIFTSNMQDAITKTYQTNVGQSLTPSFLSFGL